MGCAPSAPQERAPAKKARAAGRYVYGGAVDAAAALPPPPPGGPTPAQQRAIAEALAKGTRLFARAPPEAAAAAAARATAAGAARPYRAGDVGEAAFVVGDAGNVMGGEALLGPAPRAADGAAPPGGAAWRVDAAAARRCVATAAAARHRRAAVALARVGLLEGLTEAQLDVAALAAEELEVKAGAEVVKKGATGATMFCILEGTVDCTNIGTGEVRMRDLVLRQGEYFGERALLRDQFRAADVRARTDCVLLEVDRRRVEAALGPLSALLDANLRRRVLSSVEVLAKLTDDERRRCADLFATKSYAAGEVIVRQGDRGDAFYVLRRGRARVEVGPERRVVGSLEPGNYFGEMALLGDDARTASVVAEDDCECAVLGRAPFVEAFGSLQRICARADNDEGGPRAPPWPRHELKKVATVTGAFGDVAIVAAPDGVRYRLHAAWKFGRVPPSILGFAPYDDGARLAAHAPGGPLRRRGRLGPDAVAFYGRGVREALSVLHAANVIIRALTPDDVHVDARGRPILAEFGAARRLDEGARAFTLVGYGPYLAPEQLLGTGHGRGADLWGLGCLAYELAVGYAPFASFARSLDGAYDARGLPPKLRAAVAALLAVDAAGRDAAFPAAPVPWTPPPNHTVAESAEAFCWDAW